MQICTVSSGQLKTPPPASCGRILNELLARFLQASDRAGRHRVADVAGPETRKLWFYAPCSSRVADFVAGHVIENIDV